MSDGSVPIPPIVPMIERLCARPWRVMGWVHPPDVPRYAVCLDALATHSDAVREAARIEGAWVESMRQERNDA